MENSKVIVLKYLLAIIAIQTVLSNIITLKITGNGNKTILGFYSESIKFKRENFPKHIYINNERQTELMYKYYFNQSDNLVELIWEDKISSCHNMFLRCDAIYEIDLSEFDSSNIDNIQSMFNRCTSLVSLNLNNFNTSKVKTMYKLFYSCESLKNLNLNNFQTYEVTNMTKMFDGCSSLVSLNLSNFDFSKVSGVDYMFMNCFRLEYINIINISEKNELTSYHNMFNNTPENLVICIDLDKNRNYIFPQISKKAAYIIDCSDDWKSNQKKLINESGLCKENDRKYTFTKICYQNSVDKNLTNNLILSKCKYEKSEISNLNLSINELCKKCNNDFYQIEDDLLNHEVYINCYSNPKNYYLDENELLYKKCYNTCHTCYKSGNETNHNCLECKTNYPLIKLFDNSSNCYEDCSFNYYFDYRRKIHCTTESSCPEEYPFLLDDTKECLKNNFDVIINNSSITKINNNPQLSISIIETEKSFVYKHNINDIIQDILNKKNRTTKNETREKEDEINNYNSILENIEEILLSGSFNTSKIDNGNDEIIKTEKMIITFTSINNQKMNKNKNITSIDFGLCETILRNNYSKSANKDLYIKMVQVIQEGMKIPKIEYDVYSKITPTNFQKLNLTEICGDNKIFLSIPIELSESLDKLNSKSGYYNDICYTATSDSGTDISLKDRKREYINGNKTVCQDNCDFSEYNYITKKVNCSCKVKESSLSFSNIYIDKSKLYKNFVNINNIANLKILMCYRNLLTKSGVIKNIGNYIIIDILLFHNNKRKTSNKKYENIIIETSNSQTNNRKLICKNRNKKRIKGAKYISPIKKQKINILQIINNIRFNHLNINTKRNKKDFIEKMNSKGSISKIIKKGLKVMKYKDDELNNLSYHLAKQFDKRTYCKYYISLLKLNHDFIFTFFGINDYNSKIIKIDLFFIGFSMFYTINALFYDDDTMHNIYENKGSFDFIYQLPKDIYSSLISMVLNTILKVLALSNDDILDFKKNKYTKNIISLIKKRKKILMNRLSIKFIFYFIISYIFLILFWYYISMFGIIYKNTQYHLIKDTLISFVLSLIYPFAFYLLPGLFRIPSLSNKKNKIYLYNFSKVLQMF